MEKANSFVELLSIEHRAGTEVMYSTLPIKSLGDTDQKANQQSSDICKNLPAPSQTLGVHVAVVSLSMPMKEAFFDGAAIGISIAISTVPLQMM